VITALMPDQPEAGGLLALLLLHDARRATRADSAGDLITLEQQDRTRWDAAEIAEGVELLDRALRQRQPGPYQVRRRSRRAARPRPERPTRTGRRSPSCTGSWPGSSRHSS
jgi:predicted RNA polymerase sigma factor